MLFRSPNGSALNAACTCAYPGRAGTVGGATPPPPTSDLNPFACALVGLRIPFAGARALGTASGRSGIGAVAGRKRTCLIDSGDELVEEAGRAGVLGWDGWARGGRGEVAERVGGPGAGARRVKEEVAGAENARVSYLPRMNFSSCESRSDSSREVGGLCDGSMSRDREEHTSELQSQ